MPSTNRTLADKVHRACHPISGAAEDYDLLLTRIDDARFVLLGEASHGTHEFYKARAEITKRLIEEKGFNAVIVEADWPDAYRVNRYVRGVNDDASADEALSGFRRFPQWMWRNTDVLEFVNWLRSRNDPERAEAAKVGFYGMDLYSLYTSIAEVLQYLDKADPEAAKRARFRYSCLDHFRDDPQAYGYTAGFDIDRACEKQVVQQLLELQRKRVDLTQKDGQCAEDAYFYAEQNARLVKNAEEYYRTMFDGRESTWNLRDRHMVATIDALVRHLDGRTEARGMPTRVVVWAHNSHLGDARATDMGRSGEVNVGELARERWGRDVFNLGFTTHDGTVTAASGWDQPAQLKRVRPSLPDSWENVFHAAGVAQFYLDLHGDDEVIPLTQTLLERAIGVIYRPDTERISHYFDAQIADQFDAVIHYDHTTAVTPLERTPTWTLEEVPETYPFGV